MEHRIKNALFFFALFIGLTSLVILGYFLGNLSNQETKILSANPIIENNTTFLNPIIENDVVIYPKIAPTETTNIDKMELKIEDNYTFTFGNIAPTGSMLPLMDTGTICLLNNEPVQIGDFAVYKASDGGLVVHQIIGEQDGKWVFKGINNLTPDPDLVNKENVIFRVKALIY
jgi:hypothetical protein